jgi:hypothetical protein
MAFPRVSDQLHELTCPTRLVIEAECTTCGRVVDEAAGMSTVRLALEHTVATGHVVILNGTTDLLDADQPDCQSA